MKFAVSIIAAVVVLGIAYSLGPDVTRYAKIKSM